MSKDPAFLFYPNDYLGGTMGMSFEEKGAYMDLLMLQFNRGHLTSHMIGQLVGQIWDAIQTKFIKDEKGLYYNVRLEEEQNKRKAFTDSRKNNKLGTNQHTKEGGHLTSHMGNENENKNLSYLNIYNTIKEKNEISIPEGFEPLIIEWLKYKSEKRQSYKPIGLKSFIKTYLCDSGQNLEIAKAMLQNAMSKNYDGMFPIKQINGKPIKIEHKNTEEFSDPYWDLMKPEYR
jgi:uncharacterized protein YdaU (DUF1376 family)